MSLDDANDVSFLVVVRGPDERAFEALSQRFPNRRGGAKPGPNPREIYLAVPCAREDVGDVLAWCAAEISGRYKRLELTIHIHTSRNWANFAVPVELVEVASRVKAALHVNFISTVAG